MMQLFLLTPHSLDAPAWRNSSVREPVQVQADSEQAARRRAARFFSTARGMPARDAGAIPWHQGSLVSARVIPAADPAVRLILSGDEPD